MITLWLGLFAGLLVVQYVLLLFFLKTNWKNHFKKTANIPKVSILIAARNEEQTLPQLLESLSGLDYPPEKLEILIADDQSSDLTAKVIEDWVKNSSYRRLISITSSQAGLYHKNGKANALAILGKEASGEYLFFTDADCQLPRNWIREGISCFDNETGMVIGITQVNSSRHFEKMQEIDWWNTLGIVKIVTDLDLPTTGLGNNMVISKTAYLNSGGFEGIRFSLTEDLEVSRSIRRLGFKIRHQVTENFLVKTKAEKNWKSLLHQRKRWLAGAMTLSLPWKILLSIQFLFFPSVIALIALEWKMGVVIWILKIVSQSLFLNFFAKKAGQRIGLFPLIFFDIYQIQSLSLTILYYFWPGKVQWKSRNYP
ncbi:MAG TPA: glycosyltransferase [Algoriphagus sp.]|nr:glycosyltransferase [Algoriphagus sp.]